MTSRTPSSARRGCFIPARLIRTRASRSSSNRRGRTGSCAPSIPGSWEPLWWNEDARCGATESHAFQWRAGRAGRTPLELPQAIPAKSTREFQEDGRDGVLDLLVRLLTAHFRQVLIDRGMPDGLV